MEKFSGIYQITNKENNYFYLKISQSQKGKTVSQETKEKMRMARLGKKFRGLKQIH